MLFDDQGLIVERIRQWCAAICLPTLAFLFVYAGWRAYKTHSKKMVFDAWILFLCALIDSVAVFEDFVMCRGIPQLLNSMAQTAIILYLYFKFSDLLPNASAASNAGHMVVCTMIFAIGAIYIFGHALYTRFTS